MYIDRTLVRNTIGLIRPINILVTLHIILTAVLTEGYQQRLARAVAPARAHACRAKPKVVTQLLSLYLPDYFFQQNRL